jgi:hypothetical protein
MANSRMPSIWICERERPPFEKARTDITCKLLRGIHFLIWSQMEIRNILKWCSDSELWNPIRWKVLQAWYDLSDHSRDTLWSRWRRSNENRSDKKNWVLPKKRFLLIFHHFVIVRDRNSQNTMSISTHTWVRWFIQCIERYFVRRFRKTSLRNDRNGS